MTAYEIANAAYGVAIAKFRVVRDAYRAQTISDAEFLAAKAEYDTATKIYDAAFAIAQDEPEVADEVDADAQLLLLRAAYTKPTEEPMIKMTYKIAMVAGQDAGNRSMMTINTAEKIETIVLSRKSGMFGTFTEYAPGKFRIEADGRTVLVRCGVHGWHVSFKGFEAIDPELYIAARDALGAGKGVSVTRHVNLSSDITVWS